MIQEMIDLAVGRFPKLAKAYEKKLGQGFAATHIYSQSMTMEPRSIFKKSPTIYSSKTTKWS